MLEPIVACLRLLLNLRQVQVRSTCSYLYATVLRREVVLAKWKLYAPTIPVWSSTPKLIDFTAGSNVQSPADCPFLL